MENTCRTCLTKEGIFQSIFLVESNLGLSLRISEILNSFLTIQLIEGDGLPDKICAECAEDTVKMYSFKLKCEQSDMILRERLIKNPSSHKKIINEGQIIERLVNPEIKTENDNAHDDTFIGDFSGFESVYIESYSDKEMSKDSKETEIHSDNLVLKEQEKINEFKNDISQEISKKDLLSSDEIVHSIKVENLEINEEHIFQANNDSKDQFRIESEKNKFSCWKCYFFFSEKVHLDNHVCSLDKKQKNQKLSDLNLTRKQIKSEQFDLENNSYGCETRFQDITSDQQICSKIRAGEKPLQNNCIQKQNSLRLKKIHTGAKLYKCDVCKKDFTQMRSLLRHERIHTGEKPYGCDVCQMKFRQMHNLLRHQRIHTGEKPHECDVCGMKFIEKQHLSRHKRIHTGEKPYECDICQMKFRQVQHLIAHKRTHTGEKPYKCDVCQKDFTQMQNLLRHKKNYTGGKPHVCDV